jgi:hypothetical protein
MTAVERMLDLIDRRRRFRREDGNVARFSFANLLMRQIASMTEKTFQRVTIWLHKPSINSKHYRYIHLDDVDNGQNDFDTCRNRIDCVCSNLICTDHFRERR